VLIDESLGFAQADVSGCHVVAGDWFSSYDGQTFTDPAEIQIDHVVALKEAWDSTSIPASGPGCNVNYDPCVPDDPIDADCATGSGNGPTYVVGPVRVIGVDVYGLDGDDNGIGCD
jgi:hypothetical protein